MAVGKIGGGGRKGGPGGAKGAGGATKAGGTGFAGKVDKSESLAGPSRWASTTGVGGTDPIAAMAMQYIGQVKAGQIKSEKELREKMVHEMLEKNLRIKSKALTQKIADELEKDPNYKQKFERLWSAAQEGT